MNDIEYKVSEATRAFQDKLQADRGEFYREIGEMKRAYERRQLRKWQILIGITVFLIFIAILL